VLLGSVWIGGGVMAVALCRMAARGDRRQAAPRRTRRVARNRRPGAECAAIPSRARAGPVH
jgi:hypothetical protein